MKKQTEYEFKSFNPDMEKLREIPVGKCLEVSMNIGGAPIKMMACRPSEDSWTVKGPDGVKGKIELKNIK